MEIWRLGRKGKKDIGKERNKEERKREGERGCVGMCWGVLGVCTHLNALIVDNPPSVSEK